ncbi:uncharacterized protein LOC132202924 isoform X2 [Neocloeon triangulifer]|uniref:uncharacterized protein LOC132202924 isoform X2 n=1 Tax=Neocloeon triangulifer TaxID=2078957 RepID=UPI00286ED669|nr:uncharacterized protein LOC132202924 isoform X2 [Neocloeon triangulifer]
MEAGVRFPNYRDEENLAVDVAIRWLYLSKKFKSPVAENMVEWRRATCQDRRSVKFCELAEFRAREAAIAEAQRRRTEQRLGHVYLQKRRLRRQVEAARQQIRADLQILHARALQQKEARDAAVRKVRLKFRQAECLPTDRAHFANFPFARSRRPCPLPGIRVQDEKFQEMFKCALNFHYGEGGDEDKSRAEAEMGLTLRHRDLNVTKIDLSIPAAFAEPEEKSEGRMDEKEEKSGHFEREKVDFLAWSRLEDLKPARVEEASGSKVLEAFDVFHVMDAWLKKHLSSSVAKPEERQHLLEVRAAGEATFGGERSPPEVICDPMVVRVMEWKQQAVEEGQRRLVEAVKRLEDKYRVFCWTSNLREARGSVTFQVEIIALVLLNPGLCREQVEEDADEFLDTWLPLQKEGTDDLEKVLLAELETKGAALIKNRYQLLGSWATIRRMTAALHRSIHTKDQRFGFHKQMTTFFTDSQ